jgi:hypothetical protein
MAMVEKAAMAAAEEADNGWGGWRLYSLFFFCPIIVLPITTTATEGQGN